MALNIWGFPQPVGLITKTDQILQSISKISIDTSSVETIVNNAVNTTVNEIGEDIESAKTEIIESMPECECGTSIDCCCSATKCDIKNAVDELKEHIDNTFNGVNETELFREISEIYNKQ